MSIVKMKHLRLMAMTEDREELMKGLRSLGCVEIRQPKDLPEEWDFLAPPDADALAAVNGQADRLKAALEVLKKYKPMKKKLLSPRPEVSEKDFFDDGAYRRALEVADHVNERQHDLNGFYAQRSRLEHRRAELAPWLEIPVDLSMRSTRDTAVLFASVPIKVKREAVEAAMDPVTDLYQITWAGEDRENRYLLLVCHDSVREDVQSVLVNLGGGRVNMKDWTGPAKVNDVALAGELQEVQGWIDGCTEELKERAGEQPALQRALDRCNQDIALERAKADLLDTKETFILDGWAPAAKEKAVSALLEQYTAAFAFSDPDPEEYPEVPVQLKNGPISAPFNEITEMYSMPLYGSVDPNPLMAPFFIVFFGFMMNDIGYGILMVLGTLIFLWRAKPQGTMGNMMRMFCMCGVSSIFWGCLTGSLFGDFLPQLFKLLDPSSTFVWFWPTLFSPVNDIILVMVGAMLMGVAQIFTGMFVSMVEKFRHGKALDAITEEIAWYIILLGAVAAILGMVLPGLPPVLSTVGLGMLIGGLLLLLVGHLIRAKGIGGVVGFGGAIYNGVSGYFSDVLSYLRLMALMMAGSIIASVFNTLGSVFGLVPFIIVALIGNALNLVLNLLGCYVHTMRLQCLEFFGRFYQDGGKAFRPLKVNTKYVTVTKEEMKNG